MAYMDEHGGTDSRETQESTKRYQTGGGSEEEQAAQQQAEEERARQIRSGVRNVVANPEQQKQKGKQKSRQGLLSRMKNALVGDKNGQTKTKVKMSGTVNTVFGGLRSAVAKLAAPKVLAGVLAVTGAGTLGVVGLFTTYKNDGAILNDPPLQCEQGTIALPVKETDTDEDDVQERVNVMYDIFVNQFGYNENFLKGMLACMAVESNIDPDRLESDFILKDEKEQFNAAAGPGTNAGSDAAKDAYWEYGEAFQARGGWNGNTYYLVDGHMSCGLGLIQWTAGRAIAMIEGLDKVNSESKAVSVMDLEYQCAWMLAEFKTVHKNTLSPDIVDQVNEKCSSPEEATRFFFKTAVSGGSLNKVEVRIEQLYGGNYDSMGGVSGLVDAAAADAQYTDHVVSMAEVLADDDFKEAVAASNTIQLCVNKSHIDTNDIASAAVSISWLERGDYEDVHGAYGEYRRSARTPVMINDWNFVDGYDAQGTGTPIEDGTYADHGTPAGSPKADLAYYTTDGAPGKLDLIGCTEYYYYAHLLAFPKETGTDNAGYFSSCDRGTALAVRISGADDKFPAGNPQAQLAWAVDAVKPSSGAERSAFHNPDLRMTTDGNGGLWQFSGLLRGSDYYPAAGGDGIEPGSVMISWNVKAANGLLDDESLSGSTAGGVQTDDGTGGAVDDTAPEDHDDSVVDDEIDMSGAVTEANTRWPMSVSNTTRHIITFTGEQAVQDFWTTDWLYQQWQAFDDADRLIRGDLTIKVPTIMQKGSAYKGRTAWKSSDPKVTFYTAQLSGGTDQSKDWQTSDITGRKMEFNAKTGLPAFHSWEQIFMRLIHNSDDDASTSTLAPEDPNLCVILDQTNSSGKGYRDGYLDSEETADNWVRIAQYDDRPSVIDKTFLEDWNSVGAGDVTSDVNAGGSMPNPSGEGTYHGITEEHDYEPVATSDLLWQDPGGDIWTHDQDAGSNPYWRYELVTDIEYRLNQLLRFGMASWMSSFASEEDADVYQTGGDGNVTGHIVGNIYKRASRITSGDGGTEAAGKYYYYNTLVSNDMLQDLVQLWSEDRNLHDMDSDMDARRFGPMYLFGKVGDGMDGYASDMTSQTDDWADRRYGLTATDIANIMDPNGFLGLRTGGLKEGMETDASAASASVPDADGNTGGDTSTRDAVRSLYAERCFESGDKMDEKFNDMVTVPMHALDEPLLALYDRTKDSNTETDGRGAHEGFHTFSEKEYYNSEVYGLNPFLALESKNGLNYEMNCDLADWSAATSTKEGSVRNSMAGTSGGKSGVDGSNELEDDRLAWIDRHYYSNENGNISMFAWSVIGLNPSPGHQTTAGSYESDLRGIKTLNATATSSTGTGGASDPDSDNLNSTNGLIRYTDFIYGETEEDNRQMAKRLFGDDDRQGDGSSVRDDYNRREYIVIPYYHTHSQQCLHPSNGASPSGLDSIYQLHCDNYGDRAATSDPDIFKLDSQKWLNHLTDDYLNTLTFDERIDVRGKYDLSDLNSGKVRYFSDSGDEIGYNDKPDIHVDSCDGWTQYGPCPGGCMCFEVCGCSPVICHACGGAIGCGEVHHHSCEECINNGWCHDHVECDSNGGFVAGCMRSRDGANHMHASDAHTDDCHDKYGCNALEYLYHNPGATHNGKVVNSIYMVIQVVDDPVEPFDIHDWMIGGKVVPDKSNLVQQVQYKTDGGDMSGLTKGSWQTMMQTLHSPNTPAPLNHAGSSHHTPGPTSFTNALPAGSGLIGYFTPEGNAIRQVEESELGSDAETISSPAQNSTLEDLQRLEPLRDRMGLGKTAYQEIDGESVSIRQEGTAASGLEEILFETDGHGEAGVSSGYGWGEVAVTGTQHALDPTDGVGGYGNPLGSGSGPDGSKGNSILSFGNSLIREILGDEHVVHVKFGSQDPEGLTNENLDNGRDFLQFDTEFVDVDEDHKYQDVKTGMITDEPKDEFGTDNPEIQLKTSTPDGATNGSDMMADRATGIRREGGTSEYANGDYRLWVTHASRGTRGMMTQYLNFKSFFGDVYDNDETEMSKTACYMLFSNIVRTDGRDTDEEGNPTGSQDADGDQDEKEGFVYTNAPGDAVEMDPNRNWGTGSVAVMDPSTPEGEPSKVLYYKGEHFSDTYGQGDNSHWKNIIDVYNAAMSETRQNR